ncbi:MAG: TlyA family RNA methyltransferase [Clostridia bacterium]|nr:TlyA family RNA methyltransferase [Clostridia bacterium]
MNGGERLDVFLVTQGYASSRTKGRELIEGGHVLLNGKKALKPSQLCGESDKIEITDKPEDYVGRGALKLVHALDSFGVEVSGKTAIDIGASTGGFTDLLLRRGAKKVYAVDVGHGQLAERLRADPRVINMEGENIRFMTPDRLGEAVDLAVCDVSFISLGLVLAPMHELLRDDGELAALVKPQFEAGRENIGKNGIVRDKKVHVEVLNKVMGQAVESGFSVKGLTYSPIKGGSGNIEFWLLLKKGMHMGVAADAKAVVETAHRML